VSKRLEAGEDPFPITFCERVPSKVYEQEKKSGAETALAGKPFHRFIYYLFIFNLSGPIRSLTQIRLRPVQ